MAFSALLAVAAGLDVCSLPSSSMALSDGQLAQLSRHRPRLFGATRQRQQLVRELLPASQAMALLDAQQLAALGVAVLRSGYSILTGLEAVLPSAAALAAALGNQTKAQVRVAAYSR